MKWTKPVYWSQILTGIAGVGAVLLSDNITKWHILVSAILVSSVVVSLLVVARAETDSDRNRSHLDTLLRAMELPYFIIQAITKEIESIATAHSWQLAHQEYFEREAVYQFRSSAGQLGRLVMATQEFKDLWILDEDARTRVLEARLFSVDQTASSQAEEEYAGAVIREAMSSHVKGPHWVSQSVQADGTRLYQLRMDQAAQPSRTVNVPKERFDELLSMVPILRYQELANEVACVFSGHHDK
ncbi:MAG: hypothetical protein EPN58_18010 [Rhodanobacter sp.]|nr:MAG: hypothetical protein EPN58_18010 [Rhodanobacter sp.]